MTRAINNTFVKFALNKILKDIYYENEKIIKSKINFSSKKIIEMDPVTIFDKNIEKIIRNTIEKKYPDHSIIGEELVEKLCDTNYRWILDPIDGTKALLTGQPTWSNLVSLYDKNNSVFGLANFPCLNKTYFSDGKNSFIKTGKNKHKIKTSKITSLKKSKLITNSIHTFVNYRIYKFFKNYPNFFKITGIDAYNFCLLAEGKIDIIIESGLKQVDILPIVPIVKSAGGIIVNWQGSDDLSGGQIIACSNRILLKKFLKYFKDNY
jgi:myo-inositol-1(or 4)-monophosphatase